MELEKQNIKEIRSAFGKMKTKEDLLTLLNYVKHLIYKEKFIPFSITQLNYHYTPKANTKRYFQFSIKKKSGAERIITAPNSGLKEIQKCLNTVFQCIHEPHPAAMGFVPGKSIVDNARIHVGSLYVYNIDLKDFFFSIDQARVWGRLRNAPFNLNESKSRLELANIIASLCCHEMEVERIDGNNSFVKVAKSVLPQGAPTSPTISNIICERLDIRLSGVAKRFGLKYSRYADDITFSSMHNVYQKESEFIKEIQRIITDQKFYIKESKTRLQKEGYRQEVTGLIVNVKPNVNKRYIAELRMWIYYWEQYGYEKASANFSSRYISDKGHIKKGGASMIDVIAGKLDYLKMVKGEKNKMYLKLRERVEALLFTKVSINKDNVKSKRIETTPISLENSLPEESNVNLDDENKIKVRVDSILMSEKGAKLKRQIVIKKGETLPYEHFVSNTEKESVQIDIIRHKPFDVTKFLWHFRDSEGVKFLTHDFDLPNATFKREELLLLAEKEFNDISSRYIIPKSLWNRINWFGFDKNAAEYIFFGKRHKINWHSAELTNWLNQNPGLHPAKEESVMREEMIIPFRKSYEIKSPELLDLVIKRLKQKDLYLKFDLGGNNKNLINLDKANFYTDVDALYRGLGYLFNAINQRIGNSNKLKIEFSNISDDFGRKRIIKIIHVGSVCDKPLDRDEIIKGDLLEAEKAFFGICDWSIIAKSHDSEVNKLNVLFDINSGISPKEIIDDSLIDGFTHVLTFYSK